MLLLNYPGLAHHAKTAGNKYGPRISRAKWLQHRQVLRKLKSEVVSRKLGIDRKSRTRSTYDVLVGDCTMRAPHTSRSWRRSGETFSGITQTSG